MRLKGGKLLLDLSKYNILDEPDIAVTDEEINAILTKGLIVKLVTPNTDLELVTELHVVYTQYENEQHDIHFNSITDNDEDGGVSNTFKFILQIEPKVIATSLE